MVSKPEKTYSSKLNVSELSWGKLAFLMSLAFFFVLSGALMFFATVPLATAFLLYGPRKAGIANAFMLIMFTVLNFIYPNAITALLSYSAMLIISFLIASIVWNKENPVTGVVKRGLALIVIGLVAIISLEVVRPGLIETTVTDLVVKQASTLHKTLSVTAGAQGEMLRSLEDLMTKPETIVDQFKMYGFGSFVVLTFLVLWIGLFIVLRNAVIWLGVQRYPYGARVMTRFRMPFEMVWPLIFALTLCVCYAYEITGMWSNVIGANLIFSLGVFYFFQGAGLLVDFLTFWGVLGFFRTAIILVVAMTSYELLFMFGVIDTWVNFRKFLNKEKNEGDII